MPMLQSITLSLLAGTSLYTEDAPYSAEPEYHLGFTLAHEDTPLYLWGQYEDLSVRILGQGVGDSSIASFGIGARKSFGPYFVFGQIGYGMIDEGANEGIQQEIVYTDLLLNHRVDGRPAPVLLENDYDQSSYDTVWELEDGFLGSLGVGYQWNNVGLSVAYRPFYVKEHVELRDEDWRELTGGGWWQETRSRDLSSWQFNISYSF